MGGRRAKSVSEIVGEGLGVQQATFTRAIGEKDPDSIAASSAKLLAESDTISEVLYYASKLADFILKKSKQDLTYAEREHLARREWSRVKREENLDDNPVVTEAIVSAVTKAIGRGGRK